MYRKNKLIVHYRVRTCLKPLLTLGVVAGILWLVTLSLDPYDPRRYWIPPKIPGYDVVAVLNDTNTPCYPRGVFILVLRNVESTSNLDKLYEVAWSVRQLVPFDHFTYEIGGGNLTKDQQLAQVKKSSEQMKEVYDSYGGCIKLGPM